MIDTSKAKYTLSPAEEYTVKWFSDNGFVGSITKQTQSKTVFDIERNGISDTFTLIMSKGRVQNIEKYMENYRKEYELLCACVRAGVV